MRRIWVVVLGLALLPGCWDFKSGGGGGSGGDGDGVDVGPVDDGGTGYGVGNDGPPPVPAPALVEDRSVYDQDALDIVDLHVTILPGGATLDEVHADDDPYDIRKTEALCEVSEPGWVFPDGSATKTGTLRLRGHSSRRELQKSYRIRLDDDDNLWRNHRYLQLNKHPFDLTRMRQKLSFDLMSALPNMGSLRTRFVRLSIDGVSYGLFTLVERYDEDYLKAHGMDKGGHLYKAEFFEQRRYPEHLRNTDDPEYDVDRFEEILEMRGREDDHTKLLAMLDDLNNPAVDINTVVARYFERENFLTWWATNILLFNLDTNSQNYFLYSPRTTSAFYFLPWDYDGAWDFWGQPVQAAKNVPRRWTQGISNWWNCTLHRRFVQDPRNLADLIAKVEDLKDGFFTVERTRALLDSYRAVILDDLLVAPDFERLGTIAEFSADKVAELNAEIDRLPEVPQQSYEIFMATIERPMPVFIVEPEVKDGRIHFRWEESHDLQGDGLTYDLEVARSYHFRPEDIVHQELTLTRTSVEVPVPAAGTYYVRVIIRDTKDPASHWQTAYDSIWAEGRFFDGMREFTVE
jgi:spore coat protein H